MTKYAGFLGFLKQNAATGVATGTYNTLQQLLTVAPIGADRGEMDVSVHGDTWSDFLPGRFEGNELDLTILWDPTLTTHQNLKNDFDASTQVARYYEGQHPSWATAYRFPSIVKHWEVEFTDDAGVEAHVTLRIVSPGVSAVTPS